MSSRIAPVMTTMDSIHALTLPGVHKRALPSFSDVPTPLDSPMPKKSRTSQPVEREATPCDGPMVELTPAIRAYLTTATPQGDMPTSGAPEITSMPQDNGEETVIDASPAMPSRGAPEITIGSPDSFALFHTGRTPNTLDALVAVATPLNIPQAFTPSGFQGFGIDCPPFLPAPFLSSFRR